MPPLSTPTRHGRRYRRIAVLTLAVFGLGALALEGCGARKTGAAADPPPSVEIAWPAPPDGAQTITATGALKRQREIALSFRIPGVMTHLGVDEGDVIHAGQVLATLDPAAVEARLVQAAADLERARRDEERLAPLVERGAIPRQQYDNQKTTVAQAKAAYDSAAFDRRWAQLVSPVNGVVLTRTAQTGEVVQAGQAVIGVADLTSPLLLRAPLADRDVVRVRLGAPVQVRLEALNGRTVEGHVSRIGQQAGAQSGAVEVEITLPPVDGLRSGMIATAQITPTPAPGQASTPYSRVPAEAILEADGVRAFVLRLEPGQQVARRTAVTFGGFDGDEALISGLPVKAAVITAGAGFVADGEKVAVVDAAAFAPGRAGPAR